MMSSRLTDLCHRHGLDTYHGLVAPIMLRGPLQKRIASKKKASHSAQWATRQSGLASRRQSRISPTDVDFIRKRLERWPVVRQLSHRDLFALGDIVRAPSHTSVRPRTETADRVVRSICPYCAVGCGQRVYVKDEKVIDIEGDPDSPVSRGRLCPKGSASRNLVQSPLRQYHVKYRRPYGTDWEDLPLDRALDMIADRVIKSRAEGWQDTEAEGRRLNRTMGIASLGGATLDNEENYLIKKLMLALGIVQVENQARI
jgi:formate dehydrogenase major subunit